MCGMLIVGLVYWAVARRAHRTSHPALTDEEQREMRAEYSRRLYRVLDALDPRDHAGSGADLRHPSHDSLGTHEPGR
jgi:hypothetical protein